MRRTAHGPWVVLAIAAVSACSGDLAINDDIGETQIELVAAQCCASCWDTTVCVTCNGLCTALDFDSVTCNDTGERLECPVPCPNISVFIPNVMTPNGDGYNDVWMVADANRGTGYTFARSYVLNIYNRWGSPVYSVTGPVKYYYSGGEIFWNGRIDNTGELVSAGIYYYGLTLYNCNGSSSFYKDWINVIY